MSFSNASDAKSSFVYGHGAIHIPLHKVVISAKKATSNDREGHEIWRRTMHQHPQNSYGVDRDHVQRVIARAHRERAVYVAALFKRLFGRRADAAASSSLQVQPSPTVACLY